MLVSDPAFEKDTVPGPLTLVHRRAMGSSAVSWSRSLTTPPRLVAEPIATVLSNPAKTPGVWFPLLGRLVCQIEVS